MRVLSKSKMPTIAVTQKRHVAYCRVGQLQLVALANRHDIDSSDLAEFITAASADFRANGPVRAFFTHSATARLTPVQRRMLSDAIISLGMLGRELRANALISDSMIVRGMLTAMNWMIDSRVKVEAFSSNRIADAFTWVQGYCAFDRGEAEKYLKQMLAHLA